MKLLFCPHCAVLLAPEAENSECPNCGTSLLTESGGAPIEGDFTDEAAAKLLEANFGSFADSDEEIEPE